MVDEIAQFSCSEKGGTGEVGSNPPSACCLPQRGYKRSKSPNLINLPLSFTVGHNPIK
jgi:hypothetical protein